MIEIPFVLDAVPETMDKVFGFGDAVDLTNVNPTLDGNGVVNSDVSADTQVVPGNTCGSSSGSVSSRSSSSSSSSSSCSDGSSFENESAGVNSKKRRMSNDNGHRKLLRSKQHKRVRSLEFDSPCRRRLKRKRQIPPPVIPDEYKVFDSESADHPILKGTYSVRKNRRACFQENWGFSDEAFYDLATISPFKYTSRARVLKSRRKDDKRPISGKYGGFFSSCGV